jgi:prepilin peptidase CpaA
MTADTSQIQDTSAPQPIDNPLGARAHGDSLATSLAVAAAVATSLGWASLHSDLATPSLWIAMIFLVTIAQQDTRRRKIPNWATGAGLLAALGCQLWLAGLGGLGDALIGIAVPFVLLLGPFAARLVGAGDVKAIMVLGGLWGVTAVLSVTVWTVLVTGLMGLVLVVIRGELIGYLRRWGRMIGLAVMGGGVRYEAPGEQEAAAIGLPVGTAIGFASAVHLVLGAPW